MNNNKYTCNKTEAEEIQQILISSLVQPVSIYVKLSYIEITAFLLHPWDPEA